MDSRWGGISVGVARTEHSEVPARLVSWFGVKIEIIKLLRTLTSGLCITAYLDNLPAFHSSSRSIDRLYPAYILSRFSQFEQLIDDGLQ